MFTLVRDKSRFFRIKRGLNADEVEATLKTPFSGGAFCGRIIEVQQGLVVYVAKPGDSYRKLALKAGISEETLKKLNFGKPVYPTCRIFLPG